MRRTLTALALITAPVLLAGLPLPAAAQTTGYVTGIPGRDPAGDDEIGWGPRYRPETSFSQPGTYPTPGDFAGADYRARTGRGPYDGVQAPLTTGSIGSGDGYGYGPGGYGRGPLLRAPRHQARRAVRARHRAASRGELR